MGSPCALRIIDVNGGAAEQPLDERDAFGLRAGQKGRALADGQRLLPELSVGRLRTDRPSNGLNPRRKKGIVAADRDNACLRLLRLARALPAAVRGPLLFCAFLRLASICFAELIAAPPQRRLPWPKLAQSSADSAPAPGKPDPGG